MLETRTTGMEKNQGCRTDGGIYQTNFQYHAEQQQDKTVVDASNCSVVL